MTGKHVKCGVKCVLALIVVVCKWMFRQVRVDHPDHNDERILKIFQIDTHLKCINSENIKLLVTRSRLA